MALNFPIVDAHQHFWDPTRHYYPWLCDEPPIPFRYGDYRAIRRRYLPEDYFTDAATLPIAKTVYIETEWNPADPLGEMNYVDELRRTTGFPNVAVAQAWLDRDDCPDVLAKLSRRQFVRGIRHKPRANRQPGDGRAGGMTDVAWRRGYAQLAACGLHFELQTPWWHLHEAAQLATDFPNTAMVLNHAGLPADRSEQGITAWKAAITLLAQCPNVAVKISGLGQGVGLWTVQANRAIVLTLIETFGVERCLFASNFPVDSLCASLTTIYTGFDQIVADFSERDRHAMFYDNAIRVYRIDEAASST